jgi:hypothetical protein
MLPLIGRIRWKLMYCDASDTAHAGNLLIPSTWVMFTDAVCAQRPMKLSPPPQRRGESRRDPH